MLFTIFFFFNDTATTEIYTLSLHYALPICSWLQRATLESPSTSAARSWCPSTSWSRLSRTSRGSRCVETMTCRRLRSEEHTSELQSRQYLVCRLLLEKNT